MVAASPDTVYLVALSDIPFLPYVAGLLQARAEQEPELRSAYAFAPPVFITEPMPELVDQIVDPAVVGLSCYVWNFRRHMKLAKLVKARYPDALVVAGGPHVPEPIGSFFDEHPYVDAAVHGEGEEPFTELLRRRLAGAPVAGVPGVSTRDAAPPTAAALRGTTVVLGRQPDKTRITAPSAYLGGHLKGAVAECRRRRRRFYALWETNRGCPYSCSFCDWGSSTMSRIRRVPDERLRDEIHYFGEHEIDNVFICDANFGILPRDLDIALAIVATHSEHGYPRQIRVNFAKNSNDRVFAISKLFADNDLLMGTTLSLQSTDLDVLDAVDRRNIGTANYGALESRYADAGIHTYTELILGLPLETVRTFKDGIGSLLDAGNHDDLRVYEFGILPNAPVNDVTTLARYGLETIPKRLFLDDPATPEDEIETVETVVATSTMTGDEWVDCAVFAQAIQFLHNGCYTRYLAMHLRTAYGVGYTAFYEQLLDHARARLATVLGSIVARLDRLYADYRVHPKLPQVNLVASQPDMVTDLTRFGRRRGWTVVDWAWLCLAAHADDFFADLATFVAALDLRPGRELADVLRFQSDVVLRLDYDARTGKECRYGHDLVSYFRGGCRQPVAAVPIAVTYRDERMGVNRQYPLVADDDVAFARAALGDSYPFSRIRHYQHQLDLAEVDRLVHAGVP